MSREICICLEFLTEAHKTQIRECARAAGFVPHFFTPDQPEEARECLQRCEVLYAHTPELLRAANKDLKWYCCAFAGVDPYCKNDGIFANPACLLTNSNVYGVTIAEHVVLMTLLLLRRLPAYEENTRAHRWSAPVPIRSIYGSDFTILGTGDIGATTARRLKALGARCVTGVSRSGRAVEGAFDRVVPTASLDAVLPETSCLILALPSTPETIGILSRERIALLPENACVINVGRGTAIDQDALMDALNQERIAGAALDVMVPEPLPEEHPLWNTKNLYLTPHVAGNMTLGYTCDANVSAFCADLARYAAGQPLAHLVDRTRGY